MMSHICTYIQHHFDRPAENHCSCKQALKYVHSMRHFNSGAIYGQICRSWENCRIWYRVARWYIFKRKIPIWVNFGGSCNGTSWCILWPFGPLYNYLVYFRVIWYTFGSFWHIFLVLVSCITKNLATPIR
jgi:hypothetical protein